MAPDAPTREVRGEQHVLVTIPPFVDAAIEQFRVGLIDAVSGDIDAARAAFEIADSDRISAWCREFDRSISGWGRVRHLRSQVESHVRRAARAEAVGLRALLDRDHHRCRVCDIPVVHPDDLRTLDELLEVERNAVDGPASTDALWLLIRATVGTSPRDPRGRRSQPILCCGRCQQLASYPDGCSFDDARARRPRPAPDWIHLLGFLDLPPEAPRAIVRHALLLDGATLNVSGEVRPAPASDGELRMSVGGAPETLYADVDVAETRDGLDFHGFLDLEEALRSVQLPGVLRPELRSGDGPIPLILMPDATDSPNRAVIETIADSPTLGRTARFDVRGGVCLRVSEVAPHVDVVGIETTASTIVVTLVAHPSHGDGIDPIESVWMERRGDRSPDSRVGFDRHDRDRWRIELDGRMTPRQPESPDLWDISVAWRSDGELCTTRVGRVFSDLVDLRDAVRLPSLRVRSGEVALDARPYFTVSKHLAVRVSAAAGVPA